MAPSAPYPALSRPAPYPGSPRSQFPAPLHLFYYTYPLPVVAVAVVAVTRVAAIILVCCVLPQYP